MGFNYDFDMFSVIPEEVRQEFQGLFNEIGMGAAIGEQVALFRNPDLVQALSAADEDVKNLFLESGFGLNVYDSGTPQGRYPGHDEDARNTCLRKLADNIAASSDLKDADWGGFNLEDFLAYVVAARPIDQIELQAIASAQQEQQKKKSWARLGLVAGGALVAVSTVGIVLRRYHQLTGGA